MRLPLATESPRPEVPAGSPGSPGFTGGGAADAHAEPQRIVNWALRRFRHRSLVVTTGFGMEGCAMLDMLASTGESIDVHWIDTGFLFAETHELRDRLAARYSRLRFVRHEPDLTPEEQARVHGPELWTRDPDRCCGLRKVEPMRRILGGADAWMTAVRREQSDTRAATEAVAWDPGFELVKISPLAGWSREQVWEHVRRWQVPHNVLHERGYPSLGCIQCTAPVAGSRPEDYSRQGRWLGHEKTECGLHLRMPSAVARPEDHRHSSPI